jgi:hypothetical protein
MSNTAIYKEMLTEPDFLDRSFRAYLSLSIFAGVNLAGFLFTVSP